MLRFFNTFFVLLTLVSFVSLPGTSYSASSAQGNTIRESDRCTRYFAPYERTFYMPKNLLRAVSVTESGKWNRELNKSVAWPWTINVQGRGYHYDSKQEAIAAVKKFQAQGIESIDVGCMQINLRYHPDAFSSLDQAFEPKYNIGYAATFLKTHYETYNNWQTAIRMYHNADPVLGQRYLSRIYKTWRAEDEAFQVASANTLRYVPNIQVKPRTEAPAADISDITRSALKMFAN